MSRYDYDVAVIGAGSAGLVAVKVADGLGKKTVLIERRKIGGDCTWFGCIPSKALIKSAYVAHELTRLREFGLEMKSSMDLDCRKVMAHVRSVVEQDASGHPPESFAAQGIEVLFGGPRFIDNHHIRLGDKTIAAKKFIICTGSRPLIPKMEGLDKIKYLTNETVFDIESLPGSMIILGAGPIGIELSAALNRLGVKVTVVQRSDDILKKDDKELVDRLVETLRGEGVTFLTKTNITRFIQEQNKIIAQIDSEAGPRQIEAESVLVAVGRVPNVDELELGKAGVEFDSKGIKVDGHLRTTAGNIYAAGDVVPPYLFTHIAEYEAVIAATNACLPIPIRKINYEHVPWCTFTDPELAHAGLTEEQAREKYGEKVRVYRWDHKDVDRAKTDLAQNGLTKIVCDRKGKILGIHILGHGAAELMHEAQLAKSLGLPFSKIASVIHAYPSYSDAVRQPAKRCYVDILQNSFLVKLARIITNRKNQNRLVLFLVVIGMIVGLRLSGIGDKLTLENIQNNGAKLTDFSNAHYVLSVLAYIVIYIAVTAFSVPGATILTLTGGFLYSTLIGAVYVNIGATSGAILAFLFARHIAGHSIQEKYGDKLARFNEELDRNGAGYLLTLRLVPIFPFFLINLFAGLTRIRLHTFAWTTSLGIIPGSLVYAYAGRQLGTIRSTGDIFTPKVLAVFILLALFALMPVALRKIGVLKSKI